MDLNFFGGIFKQYCREQGISRQLTVRKTPQQNGLAERMNKTIMGRVRCMLSNAGMPKGF